MDGTYHEAAHASGAAHRLDRDFSAKWTRHALAMEEAIFTAASKAQAAADWMHARQP